MNLTTTPQRNTLLAMFLAHPAVYEVRGAARLARRVAEAGLAVQIEGTRHTRRFRLTALGLIRATKLAERRDADHAGASLAGTAGAAPETASDASRPTGMPTTWPFPVSAHAWKEAAPC